MPIYEYVCRSCNHELERLQKISDAPLTDCPDCGEAALVRKISAAGFRLKGGGWYETDFKGDKRRNVADTGDKPGDGKADDKSSSGDGDKKPAGAGKDAAAKAGTAPASKTGDSKADN